MTFEVLALITTGAGTLLGLGFMFAGRFMLKQWRLDASPTRSASPPRAVM